MTIYEQSKASGSAKVVYLALGDTIIVNDGISEDGNYYHSKDSDVNELWIAGDNQKDETVLTMLVSYNDIDKDYDYSFEKENWKQHYFENTFLGKLCDLGNKEDKAYFENIFEITDEAIAKLDDKTFKKVYKSMRPLKFYARVTDFAMHNPTPDYIHTKFCT